MSESPPAVRIALRILGEPVVAEAPQPSEPVRLDAVLPLLRQLDDSAIGIAARRIEQKGESISCRKGCAACCKAQPVPIAPAEAYALWVLVDAMPEPRRSVIRDRFADRVKRLEAAGLREAYDNRTESTTREEARAVADAYFRLGLACPFLDDDACGIYPDRPFVCRQYLVTTPAELCADPFVNPVKPISVPLAPTGAVTDVGEKMYQRPQFSLPLILALEYADRYRAELARTFDPEDVFRRVIATLFQPA